jgi:hypothetical protein
MIAYLIFFLLIAITGIIGFLSTNQVPTQGPSGTILNSKRTASQLRGDWKRFTGGLVFKALWCHSTLSLGLRKKKQ